MLLNQKVPVMLFKNALRSLLRNRRAPSGPPCPICLATMRDHRWLHMLECPECGHVVYKVRDDELHFSAPKTAYHSGKMGLLTQQAFDGGGVSTWVAGDANPTVSDLQRALEEAWAIEVSSCTMDGRIIHPYWFWPREADDTQ